MESNGNGTDEENKKPSKQAENKRLFTPKEVRTIVKDFVAAYISGQVTIDFPTANFIMERASGTGDKLTLKEAYGQEIQDKKVFFNHISIVAGTKQATTDEQQRAMNGLFSMILACRFGHRIHGVFMEYALETRIRNLEEGLDKVNHLVEEIVEWLMKGDR